ncbi:platelet glycoprotein IX [Lepidochelys kempii]|uniref:platelet glycoprotein IX n=1 Tax=Lepidochelys kempii TaxID=8472 RepID=UPI003C6F44F3
MFNPALQIFKALLRKQGKGSNTQTYIYIHTQSENITIMKIPTAAGFVTLMLFCLVNAEICPLPCICKPLGEMKGWLVDCSSKGLKEVPSLSVSTRKLYLQNNSMTTVRIGAFDSLHSLEEVNVSDNPWNCDCDILYLKLWLEDFSESSIANVICASPAPSAGKPLSQLSGNELDSCRKSLPIKCLDFFWRDLALITFVILVLILTSCALRFSKKLAYQVTTRDYYSAVPLLQKHNLENYMSQ